MAKDCGIFSIRWVRRGIRIVHTVTLTWIMQYLLGSCNSDTRTPLCDSRFVLRGVGGLYDSGHWQLFSRGAGGGRRKTKQIS